MQKFPSPFPPKSNSMAIIATLLLLLLFLLDFLKLINYFYNLVDKIEIMQKSPPNLIVWP